MYENIAAAAAIHVPVIISGIVAAAPLKQHGSSYLQRWPNTLFFRPWPKDFFSRSDGPSQKTSINIRLPKKSRPLSFVIASLRCRMQLTISTKSYKILGQFLAYLLPVAARERSEAG